MTSMATKDQYEEGPKGGPLPRAFQVLIRCCVRSSMKIEALILFLFPFVGMITTAIVILKDKRGPSDHKPGERHL